jgi:mannose-1-phosphate guanylyltransferase
MTELPSHIYAVVLAGGSGTRFWPRSRQKLPKQLCRIGDQSDSMIEVTLGRLEGFIPPERRIIVTHIDQFEATKEIVGSRAKTIIPEAAARDTGHALALASVHIEKIHKGEKPAVMISLHADAVITKLAAFQDAMRRSVTVAETGSIALMGIVPTYAETGYGYIEQGDSIEVADNAYKVKSFREKPDAKTAAEYLASGNFSWNSGIFTWKIPTIIKEFEAHMGSALNQIRQAYGNQDELDKVYSNLPKTSIDEGILEKANNIEMVTADIGWQDVGSWDAMTRVFETDAEGNYQQGASLILDSKNTVIDTDGPFIAAIGLDEMVVVASNGAILVCPKSRSQEVKKVVAELEKMDRKDLL